MFINFWIRKQSFASASVHQPCYKFICCHSIGNNKIISDPQQENSENKQAWDDLKKVGEPLKMTFRNT
jgi:hypothetical protein